MCNLTAGQVIRPLQGLGASSWALLLARQEELNASKNNRVGRSSFGRTRQSIDEIHSRQDVSDPVWSRSQARYAVDFAKWAETSGVNVITSHPYSVKHGGASSGALWRTRSLMEIQKRGRWRSEKSVRRFEKHARLLKETSKLSDATRRYGQLVTSRMSRLLSGALPPPPVLIRLCRNRA